jgi:prepilin-type N-terminal cleavage/methylation domain-containing protein
MEPPHSSAAFTLLELLVVIGIIALIAAIAVPSIHGMRPNLIAVASRQMLDDLNWARQRAISDHTTVYVIFIPNVAGNISSTAPANFPVPEQQRLLQGQYTSYAFYVKRQLGDQPGNPTVHYLTGWKTLPQGTAFAWQKFGYPPPPPAVQYGLGYTPSIINISGTNVCWTFDVTPVQWDPDLSPPANPDTAYFPCVAFDYHGSLATSWHTEGAKSGHCVIPLTKANVSVGRDPTDPTGHTLAWAGNVGFSENPVNGWIDPTLYTYIVIDGPTGKAHVEHAQVQ